MADDGTAHYRCQQRTWNLQTTQTLSSFPQRNSEVVNLTGLAENKGLEAHCGKRCLLAVNGKDRELQLFVLSGLRKDRGPQFTSGVSPKKINNMLGEQITAGQLTNKEYTMTHIHDTKITMIIMWALRQNTYTAIQLHL